MMEFSTINGYHYDVQFCLIEVRAMVVAAQQPLVEYYLEPCVLSNTAHLPVQWQHGVHTLIFFVLSYFYNPIPTSSLMMFLAFWYVYVCHVMISGIRSETDMCTSHH